MKVQFSIPAKKDFHELSESIKQIVQKQFYLLEQDFRYRSIRVKKYNQAQDIWQGRIDRNYRFYFRIEADTYIILRIIPHPQ